MTNIGRNPGFRPRGAWCVVAAIIVSALLGATPVALAARYSSVGVSVTATDEGLSVHIRASAGSRCTLRVAAGGRSSTFAPVTLDKRGRGAIKWTVPTTAPSGRWTFSTSCVKRRKAGTNRTRIVLVNHGSGAGALVTTEGNESGGKGGGGESCATIASPPGGGQVCFIGDPFATYQHGTDIGQCTWYAAGERPDLDGITTGNASAWLTEAHGKVPEGTTPVVGAVAVNTSADGGVGHVAYVAGITNGGATLILDEANLKNDEKVYLNIATPAADFSGYIYGGPAGSGPGSSSSPAPAPTPSPTPAPSPTPNPAPSPAPAPPPTYSETSGPGPVHTWTNYSNAGGTEGPSIPDNSTVQIACKLTGFAVEDGNTWWYRIASSPWNGSYYASADAFYNNGETSGSLKGTPFDDPSVPNC
jgi:surface antigen